MNVSTCHAYACFSTVALVLVTHTHTHTHRTERYRDQQISTYTGKPTECNHCEHHKGIGSIPRTRVRALQQEVFSLRSGVVVEVLVADLLQIRGRYGLGHTAPAQTHSMKKEQTRASPGKCCDVNSKYICYFPLKDRTHFNSLLYFSSALCICVWGGTCCSILEDHCIHPAFLSAFGFWLVWLHRTSPALVSSAPSLLHGQSEM